MPAAARRRATWNTAAWWKRCRSTSFAAPGKGRKRRSPRNCTSGGRRFPAGAPHRYVRQHPGRLPPGGWSGTGDSRCVSRWTGGQDDAVLGNGHIERPSPITSNPESVPDGFPQRAMRFAETEKRVAVPNTRTLGNVATMLLTHLVLIIFLTTPQITSILFLLPSEIC